MTNHHTLITSYSIYIYTHAQLMIIQLSCVKVVPNNNNIVYTVSASCTLYTLEN